MLHRNQVRRLPEIKRIGLSPALEFLDDRLERLAVSGREVAGVRFAVVRISAVVAVRPLELLLLCAQSSPLCFRASPRASVFVFLSAHSRIGPLRG